MKCKKFLPTLKLSMVDVFSLPESDSSEITSKDYRCGFSETRFDIFGAKINGFVNELPDTYVVPLDEPESGYEVGVKVEEPSLLYGPAYKFTKLEGSEEFTEEDQKRCKSALEAIAPYEVELPGNMEDLLVEEDSF